jgi:hypothetical protein
LEPCIPGALDEKEESVHAVMVRATVHDVEGARQTLNEEGVARISQMPGFVCGYWLSFGSGSGGSVIVFESEDQANTAADQVRANPAAGSAVTLDTVDVGEVVASG